MFNKTLASDPAVRECLRSGLDILKTALALAATRITTKGLTEGATEDLIESAAQTMADCLPAVDPVVRYKQALHKYERLMMHHMYCDGKFNMTPSRWRLVWRHAYSSR